MSNSRKITMTGESAGTLEIIISDSAVAGIKKARIIYQPDPSIPVPQSMLFGYRDIITGHFQQIEVARPATSEWIFERNILLNETSDFYLHPNTKINELNTRPNIIDKIVLKDGKIIEDAYINPDLMQNQKGDIKRYVHKNNRLYPADDKHQLSAGEKFVDIYFPANYDEKKQYPLQVFLDGDLHVTHDPFGQSMNTPAMLDNLIAQGKIEPVIAVFTAPTSPTPRTPTKDNPDQWAAMPRLGEYACNLATDAFLENMPNALHEAGISITDDPRKTYLVGQSMGGLQAIYTAKRHPDVYGNVIAQSPAVWWGPPTERLTGNLPDRPITYSDYPTWCADPGKVDQGQYVLKMLQTGYDELTHMSLPASSKNVTIFLQAGSLETGNPALGHGPLRESTEALAQYLGTNCFIHDGAHIPDMWATGLAVAMLQMLPKTKLVSSQENSASAIFTALANAEKSSPLDVVTSYIQTQPSSQPASTEDNSKKTMETKTHEPLGDKNNPSNRDSTNTNLNQSPTNPSSRTTNRK